jgi:hypothetical protein
MLGDTAAAQTLRALAEALDLPSLADAEIAAAFRPDVEPGL